MRGLYSSGSGAIAATIHTRRYPEEAHKGTLVHACFETRPPGTTRATRVVHKEITARSRGPVAVHKTQQIYELEESICAKDLLLHLTSVLGAPALRPACRLKPPCRSNE